MTLGVIRVGSLGHRNDHAIADGGEEIDAPVEQRPTRAIDERLGPIGAQALAAAAGGDDPDDG